MQQSNRDAVAMGRFVFVPEIQGYEVQFIREIGICTGGRGDTVLVSGKTPVPSWRQLAVNLIEYEECVEVVGMDR